METFNDLNEQIRTIQKQKYMIESALSEPVTQEDIDNLKQDLQQLIFQYETAIGDRVETTKLMLQEFQKVFQNNVTLNAAKEDMLRIKNAIDIAQRDIFCKRQISLELK